MKNKKNMGQWVMLFLLGLALIAVYKMFDSLGWIWGLFVKLFAILTPFVIGFGIAFLLHGPVNWLDERFRRIKGKFFEKAARPLAVFLTYIAALGIVVGLVWIIIPQLAKVVAEELSKERLEEYYKNIIAFIDQYTKPGGLLEGFDVQSKIDEAFRMIGEYFTMDRILSVATGLWRFASSIVDVVMALIVSVYMLLGKESLTKALKSVLGLIFKPRTMQSLSLYTHQVSEIFYKYLYSQLLDATVVATLATIGFTIARMPGALVFGILMGVSNMIPYFGALIGGVICSLVMLITSGNLYSALFVAIYILVMQQIDANIIQPRIVGDTVGIKPIYVLLGITLFGGLFGFWGIFLGAPAIAVVQLLLTDYIRYRQKKEQKRIVKKTAPVEPPKPDEE